MAENNRRKAERRRRRRRNQRIVYAVAAVLLVLVGAGVFAGGKTLVKATQEPENFGSESTENTEAVQSQNASEGTLQSAEQNVSTEENNDQETQMQETMAEEMVMEGSQELSAQQIEEMARACVESMTLEEKVAGLFVVTPEALTGVSKAVQAGETTKAALEQYPVGGVIYFKQNIQSKEQITTMLADTASYSKYPLFLAVDEEGGSVVRVADTLGFENVGNMADIGASGDVNQAYTANETTGNYLADCGFNLDFAPVADVLTNPDNTAIGKRAFSSDAQVTADMVSSAVQGLQSTGISACLKHFPGHGDTIADTHDGSAETNRTLEQMQSTEFLPFQSGMEAGVDMIMVGHISAPQLTGGDATPASMSKEIITDILRKQLGYNGIVITDAMNMGAISNYESSDMAAVKALRAGADMILMPEDFKTAYEGVLAAVKDGTVSEERINDSLMRIYRVKYRNAI